MMKQQAYSYKYEYVTLELRGENYFFSYLTLVLFSFTHDKGIDILKIC